MLVPIAFLFCPATSHMTIKLLAVGVQLTIRAQSQSASRDCSRSGTSRAKGITTKALRSGIRTIFAATMPRFVLMLMCDQEGPFESVAPSSIKLIGTAAPPMRSMPEKSQPRGAECRGTSRALIGGERPTRMPRVDAITAVAPPQAACPAAPPDAPRSETDPLPTAPTSWPHLRLCQAHGRRVRVWRRRVSADRNRPRIRRAIDPPRILHLFRSHRPA
mmetsp:Transcript_30697/g.71548  ORF Transcript_30697/g.71548 Transcript_30697/m.71548 type:complete len:218 (+) Transcript_30697:157-810(+)